VPDLDIPQTEEASISLVNPVLAVSLLVQEAELLKINAATAAIAYVRPDGPPEGSLRDLSPLGR